MNKDEAAKLVGEWVHDWRLFLDGGLHWKAREALVERIVAASKPAPKKRAKKAASEELDV